MNNTTIAIGNDHAGFEYKQWLSTYLQEQGYELLNFGTDAPNSVDYPDFAHPTAEAVAEGNAHLGILICGSANGVAMTANKHQAVRAAICWIPEIASLARQHNNANVLCIPARFVSKQEALSILKAFLTAEFEGGRHARRVGKIACM